MYFYDLESGTFVGMSLTLQHGFETNLSLIEKPGTSVGLRFYCYLNGVQLLPWPVCDCLIIHPGKGRWANFFVSCEKKNVRKDTFVNTAHGICPLYYFLKSHFTQVYKLEAFQETKMENIPLSNVSLSKRPIFIFVTQHRSHPIYFVARAFWSWKKKTKTNLIAPALLRLSISHGNLNCHNKVFFQDLSSNSLSFLLKWLLWERERHKSRRGIVIQNRWTLNHRWFWERAKQSLPLRKKRGEAEK